MKTVFIDLGHGGMDSGAVGNGLREKDLTLEIGLEAGRFLRYKGIKVMYSRTIDKAVSLTKRTDLANQANADIFVSFHINSATRLGANGVETFHYPGSVKGKSLANDIQNSLVKSNIFESNRGVKSANFSVLRRSKMPSALVELGFISNSRDARILQARKNDIAKVVAQGILKNLGIEYREKVTTPKPKTNIPSSWAKDSWDWGIENKITDGTNPKSTATREEIITMIKRSKEVK